jgi:hypothetical protein
MTKDLATRRLIIWSARLSDLWEPKQVADFMLSPQEPFGGKCPVDMMSSDELFDAFDRHMRVVLDGVYR